MSSLGHSAGGHGQARRRRRRYRGGRRLGSGSAQCIGADARIGSECLQHRRQELHVHADGVGCSPLQLADQQGVVQLDRLPFLRVEVFVVGDGFEDGLGEGRQYGVQTLLNHRRLTQLGAQFLELAQSGTQYLVDRGRFEPWSNRRQLLDSEGEVLQRLDSVIEPPLFQLPVQLAGGERLAVLSLEFRAEQLHALGFLPEGNVGAVLVLDQVGGDDLGVSRPLLEDDAQVGKPLVTLGVQLLGDAQAGVATAVGRVLAMLVPSRDGEHVGDAIGLDTGLDLLVVGVRTRARVVLVLLDLVDGQHHEGQIGVVTWVDAGGGAPISANGQQGCTALLDGLLNLLGGCF